MKYCSSLISAIVLLGMAHVAFAAPASVTDLQAKFEKNGNIAVSWKKVRNEKIDHYRVYYSSKSILENQGEYDDFDSTEDDRSLYIFENLEPDTDVYVAVLAVNEDGEESEFFSEEILIHVPMKRGGSRQRDSAEEEVVEQAEEEAEQVTVQLLGAQSISPNEVRVNLSEEIDVRSKGSANLFSITQPSGAQLAVHKVVSSEGTELVLETDEQSAGKVYQIGITEMFAKAYSVSIDDGASTTLFTGFSGVVEEKPKGKKKGKEKAVEAVNEEAASPPPPQQPPSVPTFDPNLPPEAIKNLTITFKRALNGTYHVSATWNNAGALNNVAYLVVAQSFDGGKTYSEPQFVPPNVLSLELKGVPAGNFGLFVQSMDSMGRIAPGAFASVNLAGAGTMVEAPSPDPQPAIEEEQFAADLTKEEVVSPDSSGTLPESGTGLIAIAIMFGGALLGWGYQRFAH